MNRAEVNILVTARDQASSVFQGVSAQAAKIGKSISGAMSAIGSQAGGIVKAGAAVAGLVGGFITLKDSISSTQQLTGEVSKLARVSGLTAQESSHLLFAFRQTGLEADDAGRAIGILAKKLKGISDDETGVVEGGKQVSAIFKDLGIAATFTDGEIRPLNELINELADKFKVMPNGLEKTGLAMQIFGKSGADLIPLLNQGSDGLRELAKEADKLGVTLTGKNLEQVKKLTAAQRDLKEATSGIKLSIGSSFIPALTLLNQTLVRLQPPMRRFIDQGIAAFTKALLTLISFVLPPVIKAFDFLGDKLTFLKPVFAGLGVVAGSLAIALITIGPALATIMPLLLPLFGLVGAFLSPVGLLILGLGALAVVFRGTLSRALKDGTTNLLNFVGVIKSALTGDVQKAADLFNKLPRPLQDLALWLANNKKPIEDFATDVKNAFKSIGDGLASAGGWLADSGLPTMATGLQTIFEIIKPALQWIIDNRVAVVVAFGVMGAAALLAFTPVTGPVLLIVTALAGMVFAIGKVREAWDEFVKDNDNAKKSNEDNRDSQILLQRALEEVGDTLKTSAQGYLDTINKGVIPLLYEMGRLESYIVHEFVPAFGKALGEDLKVHGEALMTLFRNIRDVVVYELGWIPGFFAGWGPVFTGVRDDIGSLAYMIAGVFTGAMDRAKDVAYFFQDALYAVRDAAWAARDAIQSAIDKLKFWERIPGAGALGGALGKLSPAFASGGVMPYSGLAMVGEEGRELVAMPGGSRIYNNRDTERMMGGPSTNNITISVHVQGDATDRTVERMKQALQDALVRATTMSGLGGGFTPVGAYNQ